MGQHIKAAASAAIKLFMKQKAVTLAWLAIGRDQAAARKSCRCGFAKVMVSKHPGRIKADAASYIIVYYSYFLSSHYLPIEKKYQSPSTKQR